ncbi:carbohydrate-binding module family 18 protein [Hypoxylon sp. FL1150]|nr:carbohydrate-binding module family 18 protein [Hypoxylon sp. FL1150]
MKLTTQLFRGLTMAGLAVVAGADDTSVPLRKVMYIDQYHTSILPGKNVTQGMTHAIMAFANSSLFATDPKGDFKPFMDPSIVRRMFDNGTKLCIAIGGWGDTAGFSQGAATEASRKLYAKNVRTMVDWYGFDGVDVDWEYPGGNGADYKQTPNTAKQDEIAAFPLFLQDIKSALGSDKTLSIAVPGTPQDMIAYNSTTDDGNRTASIFDAVDMVNVMAYDLLTRRNTETQHHTSVAGSLAAVRNYLDAGAPPAKINLGFAFYAKYFETPAGTTCDGPVGCKMVLAENADGSDSQTSGAMTFEKANMSPPPAQASLVPTTNSLCGAATAGLTCNGVPGAPCCSQYGFCGSSPTHCGQMCQFDYSTGCTGPNVLKSFHTALKNGKVDDEEGGVWYWDSEASLYWTWDSEDMMRRKFREIVEELQLGGIMAWSLGEDSADWSRVQAWKDMAQFPGHDMGGDRGCNASIHLRAHAHGQVH